jgi:hypothetical protein
MSAGVDAEPALSQDDGLYSLGQRGRRKTKGERNLRNFSAELPSEPSKFRKPPERQSADRLHRLDLLLLIEEMRPKWVNPRREARITKVPFFCTNDEID